MLACGERPRNGATRMPNAECGMRNRSDAGPSRRGVSWLGLALEFRIPHSALRILLLLSLTTAPLLAQAPRPRARDLGIVVGMLPSGPLDAITDVAGVRVGHVTIAQGDSINTGVTAILPHEGNVFRERAPLPTGGATASGNRMGARQG